MIKLTKALSIGLCATMLMFSCSKDMEDVNPSSTLSGVSASNIISASKVIGPYSVSDLTNDGNTWAFTVQRTGAKEGNGLSHLILNLRDCDGEIIPLAAEDVAGASITGVGGNFTSSESFELKYSEGSGTGCDMKGASGFVKYDDLDDVLSDGTAYTFTLTLNKSVKVETVDVWVKAGKSCYQGVVAGPGCVEEVGCSYSNGQLKNSEKNVLDVSGVAILVGGKEYTGAEAVAIMNSKVNTSGTKAAFSQIAAIRISEELGKLLNTNAIAADLATVDAAFAQINRINTTEDSGTISQAAKVAADRIGEWIGENKCVLEEATIVVQPSGKSKK